MSQLTRTIGFLLSTLLPAAALAACQDAPAPRRPPATGPVGRSAG